MFSPSAALFLIFNPSTSILCFLSMFWVALHIYIVREVKNKLATMNITSQQQPASVCASHIATLKLNPRYH